jgi:S-adenosylmethionine synthetase
MPFLCRHIPSESAYFRRKEEVLAALIRRFSSSLFELEWRLNCLDQPGRGADGTYLTLRGTSAEDADSGQVGRGNRVNGLIAFARPTGGEAAAGKNPVAHVGKVYNVLSTRLAQLIHARCPALEEVYVHLATRIGAPVDEPWVAVQIVSADGITADDIRPVVRDVVAAELSRMPEFRAELIRGAYGVC